MSGDRPVFLHFDVDVAPDQERFEVRVRVKDGTILFVEEFQVALEGDASLVIDQAWCVVSGDGTDDGGLAIKVDGVAPPPLRAPRLLLNQVVASVTPAGDRLYVVGPSRLHLPTTGELTLRFFRTPAKARATAIVSLTGSVRDYDGPPLAAGGRR